ncbi:hypothetical protein MMAG44476_01380 [Mycolicibacterium mageritense DSM 44476 = CIP 104973]
MRATTTNSASRLSNACGAGCSPRSPNPNNPVVRDSANAATAPADPTSAARCSQAGPPTAMSTPSAPKVATSTRNPGPIIGMCW